MSLLGKVGQAASSAAQAAQRAAEKAAEAAKKAAEAAAEAAAKAAEEAAKKAAEEASKAAEQAQQAAERGRDAFEDTKDAVSGAVDKAKDTASAAANKVKDTASAAVDKAKDTASAAANKVKDTASAAVDKAKDTASAAVDKAKDTASAAANKAKDTASNALDFTKDVFEDARGAVGRGASEVAQRIGQGLDKATDVAATGLDKAGTAIENAPTGYDPLRKIGNQLTGAALHGAADVVRDPVETARAVKDTANLNREVDTLEPGEQAKVSLEAEGHGAVFGAKGKGTLSVTRNTPAEDGKDGGYTVAVDGEVGAGVVGKLGGTGAAEIGGSAYLNAGAKVEFKFDTAEEAKRATHIIAKSALASAANGAVPGAGMAANQVLGDPMSDLAGLTQNMSAMEVQLKGEAEGSVGVGMEGLEGVASAGGSVGANAELSRTARLELENGQPTKMSIKQTLALGANAGVEAGLGTPKPADEQSARADLPTSVSASGQGSFKAEFERSFDLPKDFDTGSLLRDPAGTAREVAQTANASQEAKLTLTDSREGSFEAMGLGASGGREVKLEMTGNVQEIARSGALGSVARGELGEAVRQLDGKVETKATLQNKTTASSGVNLGVHGGVAGGEVGLNSERTHLGEEKELTPDQLVSLYQQFYAPGATS